MHIHTTRTHSCQRQFHYFHVLKLIMKFIFGNLQFNRFVNYYSRATNNNNNNSNTNKYIINWRPKTEILHDSYACTQGNELYAISENQNSITNKWLFIIIFNIVCFCPFFPFFEIYCNFHLWVRVQCTWMNVPCTCMYMSTFPCVQCNCHAKCWALLKTKEWCD